MIFKKRYIFLPILILVFSYLIYSVYDDVKEQTINDFNSQQMLVAQQAAKSIENLFEGYLRELTYIAGIKDVIDLNKNGEALLSSYYGYNSKNIRAVTRVDTSGKIIFTVPENPDAIGADISYQKHVAEILKNHKPIMSDVFDAVQNYKAIAFHVPVFKNGRFNGSLGILIQFDSITKEYLQNIKTGKNGYAWMLSQQGIELYCPVPGHTGRLISETSDNFESVLEVAQKMMRGEEGVTTYYYGHIHTKSVQRVKKQAVFLPIRLTNTTFWSICVATPEDEVLATMTGLKNKLLLIVVFFIVVGIIVTYYFLKAVIVLIEEKKRKKIENALRASEQQFRSYVDNAPDGILVFRQKGNFIDVNNAVCNISGYTKEELLNLAFLDLIPIENHQKVKDFFDLLFKNKNSTMDVYFLRKDRTKKLISIDAVMLEDEKYLAFIRDITDRKQLEEQFRQSQKMEAIGHLAGGIAHDFNNILTIINGYGEMLMEFPDSKTRKDDLKQILKAGKRAEALTSQLLAFSRKQVMQPKVLNLNELLSESKELLQRLIGENIKLSVNFQEDLHNIKADPTQLEQVILNLVINARDAMPQGGQLIIETKNINLDGKSSKPTGLMRGKYVLLSLSDTGVGMDKEIITRIFDPFFTTKEEGKGTGLGLSTAYGIIKQSGGSIFAESEQGKGATFSIYFNAVKEEISNETSLISDNKRENTNDTILVVEDEDAVRELTVRALEQYGFHVLAASGGVEALQLLQERNAPVSLLLTDVIMPGQSGQEVADSVKRMYPETQVIFMSGYTGDTIDKHGVFDGYTNFIHKPFTPAKLINKIREVLT